MNLQTHTFRYLDRNGNGWTRQVRCAGISEALADLKSNPDAASVCSWTVSTEQTVKPAVLWAEDMWPLRLSRH